MADEIKNQNEDVPAAPAPEEKTELTDDELSKVSGGGAVVEDKVAVKYNTTLSPTSLKSWGDPH